MSLWHNLEAASGVGGAFVWLVAGFFAAAFGLAVLLPRDRTRMRAAAALFLASLGGLLVATQLPGGATGSPYRWVRAASLFAQSAAVVTLAGVIIFDVALKSVRLKPPAILCDIILAIGYLAAGLMLLSRCGVDVSGLVATSAVVTAVIGFSLQDTLGNVMGGMALQMERTIGVGDWIKVDNNVGVVKEIRWRQTSIETRAWDTIVIPNSVLMKSQVTVLGRRSHAPRQHRQTVQFHVDYRYPPTEVIAAVESAVAGEPIANVSREPAAFCLLLDFKESYAEYAVRYWLTDLMIDDGTDSVVRNRIVFALRRAGISVAIPALRTFQTEEDAVYKERKDSENLSRRLAAVAGVDLFHTLTEDERRRLAGHLRETPFARGETMTKQGTESHCLYVITSGAAEVRLAVDGSDATRTVATLHGGDFFGEMGLMTGDRRSATVVATSDANCFRLDKEGFMEVLHERPEIAESISHILAARRVELDAAREHLTGEAMKLRLKKTQGDLLHRMRKFFTLEH